MFIMIVAIFINLLMCHGVDPTPLPATGTMLCAVTANGTVSLSIITDTKPQCDVGLTNPGIYNKLEYRQVHASKEEDEDWRQLGVVSIPTVSSNHIMKDFNFDFTYCNTHNPLVQFRLIQWEHGGGDCNCWAINGWNVSIQNRLTQINENRQCSVSGSRDYVVGRYGFCSGSASVPRGFLSHVINLRSGKSAEISCPARLSHIIKHVGLPLKKECPDTKPKIIISFRISFIKDCDSPESADKGVELALGNWERDGYWIPLIYLYLDMAKRPRIDIGNITNDTLHLRGFDIPAIIVNGTKSVSLEICDSAYLRHEYIQFRWLETSRHSKDKSPPIDVWLLDDVTIKLVDNSVSKILLKDSFENNMLNPTLWKQDVRNGILSNNLCRAIGDTDGWYLLFSNNTAGFRNERSDGNIVSRLITTASLEFITLDPAIALSLQNTLNEALDEINSDPRLQGILTNDPGEAILVLDDLTSSGAVTNRAATVYLLGDTLSRTNRTTVGGVQNVTTDPLQESQTMSFLSVGNNIISQGTTKKGSNNVLGSSVLSTLDRFAFDVFDDEGTASVGNIKLQVTRQNPGENDGLISVLDSEMFESTGRKASLHLPSQLLLTFRGQSDDERRGLRLTSFVFENVNGLFPDSVPDRNDTELASGIISTAVQCGNDKCPTDNLELNESIRIVIQHSDIVKNRIMKDNTSEVTCVFWEFLSGGSTQDENIFSAGQWSDRGCARNENLSNESITVCECNHLTHFAILLSAAPVELPDSVALSLEIISYVGVSVSLVAMALTVITFFIQKSVCNMRNFIHVNLCISLGIAQIIFVAGVDKSARDHVPIHCQVIAVFLHYFFLVAFMWMLMEGVVLYLLLVKVFVAHNSMRYNLIFTVASYGSPLLYLFLTIPLGFGLEKRNKEDYYGYNTACFLNPNNHFIWAFIAPVIVILVINVGFFIMAAIIMFQHVKKRTGDMDMKKFQNWLKSLVPLVVIMGLTWVFGLLIVQVEELIPLAYIYTILVAFQGLFIFLIFVCLSPSVREGYLKLLKTKIEKSETLTRMFSWKSTGTVSDINNTSNKKYSNIRRSVEDIIKEYAASSVKVHNTVSVKA